MRHRKREFAREENKTEFTLEVDACPLCRRPPCSHDTSTAVASLLQTRGKVLDRQTGRSTPPAHDTHWYCGHTMRLGRYLWQVLTPDVNKRQIPGCMCMDAGIKVKRYSSSWEPTSELLDITCHVGSHSLTCHLTQVNVAHLTSVRNAGARFTYPRGMKGWVVPRFTHPQMVTHPSINRARCRVTMLIENYTLLLRQARWNGKCSWRLSNASTVVQAVEGMTMNVNVQAQNSTTTTLHRSRVTYSHKTWQRWWCQ